VDNQQNQKQQFNVCLTDLIIIIVVVAYLTCLVIIIIVVSTNGSVIANRTSYTNNEQ